MEKAKGIKMKNNMVKAPEPIMVGKVKFYATREEVKLMLKIAERAISLLQAHDIKEDAIQIMMDLEATHCNGCPLDLAKLLKANDFNLMHDICGIHSHLDRNTGKLLKHFLPRCSK